MENFGVHDKIEIDERTFLIHTGTHLKQRKIVSEVFEGGLFLAALEMPIQIREEDAPINYDYLREKTQSFHQAIIEELEVLYRIAEKLNKFKHPISHFHLGCLFLSRNLYPEAIEQFQKSIAGNPTFVKAHIGLGIAYLKSRDFKKALETFREAQQYGEKFPDILNYIGLTLLFLGELDQAITHFQEAIDINPNYFEAQFNLGVALYKSALVGVKNPQAVAIPARVTIYLKQVRDLEKYQSEEWQAQFNQLLELLRDNNHEVILPEIEKLQLQLIDFSSEKDKIYEFYLRFLFGGTELSLETIEKYEHYFEIAGKNGKGYADYWNDIGIFNLIKSRGYYLMALSEFEKAMKLAPEFEETRRNRDLIKSNERGFLILLRAILK